MRRFIRPAAGIPQIDETQIGLGCESREERRLLLAGDQQGCAFGRRGLEARAMAAAQFVDHLDLALRVERARDRRTVDRLGAKAGAKEAGAAADTHETSPGMLGGASRWGGATCGLADAPPSCSTETMTQGPEETRIPERTAIDTPSAERSRTLTLGVVVERQPTGHRWQAWRFVPVAVQPGVVSDRPWRLLAEEDGVSRYLAASLTLELHRKEATDYRANLAGRTPVVYVVMRPEPGAVFAWRPAVVTVSPSRAEAAVEYGDDMVETVADQLALTADPDDGSAGRGRPRQPAGFTWDDTMVVVDLWQQNNLGLAREFARADADTRLDIRQALYLPGWIDAAPLPGSREAILQKFRESGDIAGAAMALADGSIKYDQTTSQEISQTATRVTDAQSGAAFEDVRSRLGRQFIGIAGQDEVLHATRGNCYEFVHLAAWFAGAGRGQLNLSTGVEALIDSRTRQVWDGDSDIPAGQVVVGAVWNNDLQGGQDDYGFFHVGISLGGACFVHESTDVHENSFDPTHENYSEALLKSLLHVRRVVGADAAHGVVQLAEHPLYQPSRK
ncbi:MAG: DUF3305 domain-containing protein [Planctomycetes bacterium]|nr:DUF3305 domain-containing protein [Planctomycetota bacterium]